MAVHPANLFWVYALHEEKDLSWNYIGEWGKDVDVTEFTLFESLLQSMLGLDAIGYNDFTLWPTPYMRSSEVNHLPLFEETYSHIYLAGESKILIAC